MSDNMCLIYGKKNGTSLSTTSSMLLSPLLGYSHDAYRSLKEQVILDGLRIHV